MRKDPLTKLHAEVDGAIAVLTNASHRLVSAADGLNQSADRLLEEAGQARIAAQRALRRADKIQDLIS